MTDHTIDRGDSTEMTLEIEALEERVAPGLLLGAFVGASVSVGASVHNGWWSPPPPPSHGWWW